MSSTIADRPDSAAPGLFRVKRAGKRLCLAGGALIVALAAGWYAYDWWMVGRFIETTDDAFVGGDVTVIAPKVSGLIAAVAVADNQAVHAGDLLVKLDDRDYRAALAKARARVDGAAARLANLDATRRLQQAFIAQARADIDAAQAEIVRTGYDSARYRQLAAGAAASQQALQKTEADHAQALAAGQRAAAALDAAMRQLDVIDTQKQEAEAAHAEAIAERDAAALDLDYTELRAPIDGVIGNRSARPGEFAATGVHLISLVPSRGLWVDANFKESQLAGMRPGEKVQIRADVLPGQVFEGRVESLAPATGAQFSVLPAENATGNFTKIVQRVPVRIALSGDAANLGRLRPGLSVIASVDQRAAASAAP
jgi:membrane fusion protein, multidrug efflux system